MISPLENFHFKGKDYLVKRDDKLGVINGNKARKLHFFLQNPPKCKTLVSYGSSQGNAMLALSFYALEFNFEFVYFTTPLGKVLSTLEEGNLAKALKNGMKLVECKQDLEKAALNYADENCLFIPLGVAMLEAEEGIKQLALELTSQLEKEEKDIRLVLPSGTGTCAAYLAKHTKYQVSTIACVGNTQYLKEQILKLEPNYTFKNLSFMKPLFKRTFAKPYKEFYQLFNELLEAGCEFDLLYDMLAWENLLQANFKEKIVYIHQGGLEGNLSMMQRYKYKLKLL